MGLKLPPPDQRRTQVRAESAHMDEPLQTADTIEYTLTVEVSPKRGQKAWLKFGTQASVRERETTDEAVERITRFVETELDKRFDELSD